MAKQVYCLVKYSSSVHLCTCINRKVDDWGIITCSLKGEEDGRDMNVKIQSNFIYVACLHDCLVVLCVLALVIILPVILMIGGLLINNNNNY